MLLAERGGHADETLRLAAKEARALDQLLDILLTCGGERACVGVAGEQRRRDHVHALVGALRAQDGCAEQLERAPEVEGAVRVGIALEQALEHQRGMGAQRWSARAWTLPTRSRLRTRGRLRASARLRARGGLHGLATRRHQRAPRFRRARANASTSSAER